MLTKNRRRFPLKLLLQNRFMMTVLFVALLIERYVSLHEADDSLADDGSGLVGADDAIISGDVDEVVGMAADTEMVGATNETQVAELSGEVAAVDAVARPHHGSDGDVILQLASLFDTSRPDLFIQGDIGETEYMLTPAEPNADVEVQTTNSEPEMVPNDGGDSTGDQSVESQVDMSGEAVPGDGELDQEAPITIADLTSPGEDVRDPVAENDFVTTLIDALVGVGPGSQSVDGGTQYSILNLSVVDAVDDALAATGDFLVGVSSLATDGILGPMSSV